MSNKHAHCLFQVKANQPTLLDRCQRLPWHRVPELDRTRDRGHGRIEIRTLKAVSVSRFGFPHAVQILQVTRKTRDLHDHPRRCTTVTVYAVTSLGFAQASPARLADLLRGHWAIEALHHVRDVTFCEDSSQTRTGAAPNVMAYLRRPSLARWPPAACRTCSDIHGFHWPQPLPCSCSPSPPTWPATASAISSNTTEGGNCVTSLAAIGSRASCRRPGGLGLLVELATSARG